MMGLGLGLSLDLQARRIRVKGTACSAHFFFRNLSNCYHSGHHVTTFDLPFGDLLENSYRPRTCKCGLYMVQLQLVTTRNRDDESCVKRRLILSHRQVTSFRKNHKSRVPRTRSSSFECESTITVSRDTVHMSDLRFSSNEIFACTFNCSGKFLGIGERH